jgi:hypothetical protein
MIKPISLMNFIQIIEMTEEYFQTIYLVCSLFHQGILKRREGF